MSIKGSVVRATEIMTEAESMEAFRSGIKEAISAARELRTATCNPVWGNVIASLQCMLEYGEKLYTARGMSRLETMMATNAITNSKLILN